MTVATAPVSTVGPCGTAALTETTTPACGTTELKEEGAMMGDDTTDNRKSA